MQPRKTEETCQTHAHTHPVTHRHRLHCNTVSTIHSYQCPERCVNKKTVHKLSTPRTHKATNTVQT